MEEGIYRAPIAGPKVLLMYRIGQPIKSGSQDFSLDGGRDRYRSSSWGKAAPLLA
ncbi:hypothetical protein A2U01_0081231, partial [Trifolium medium]|nr:hypothetical protein [Trifolium medium]